MFELDPQGVRQCNFVKHENYLKISIGISKAFNISSINKGFRDTSEALVLVNLLSA